jgi:hypothetical protein
MWSGARGVTVVARELGAVFVIVNAKAGGDGDSMRIWGSHTCFGGDLGCCSVGSDGDGDEVVGHTSNGYHS